MFNLFNDDDFSSYKNFMKSFEEFFNKPFLNDFSSLEDFDVEFDGDETNKWYKKTYTSKDGKIKMVKFYQTNLGINHFDSKNELLNLKNELEECIKEQDFENAVILRDKIKNYETNKTVIQDLEKQLEESIRTQNFEKSIELRDKINNLKNK